MIVSDQTYVSSIDWVSSFLFFVVFFSLFPVKEKHIEAFKNAEDLRAELKKKNVSMKVRLFSFCFLFLIIELSLGTSLFFFRFLYVAHKVCQNLTRRNVFKNSNSPDFANLKLSWPANTAATPKSNGQISDSF